MRPVNHWILYSVARIALFASVFAVLVLLGLEVWLAAVLAAVVGLCVSFIFLKQPPLPGRGAGRRNDDEVEDSLLEGDRGGEA